MDTQRLYTLLQSWLQDRLDPASEPAFWEAVTDPDAEATVKESLAASWDASDQPIRLDPAQSAALYDRIMETVRTTPAVQTEDVSTQPATPVIPMPARWWRRGWWRVAAILLLLTGMVWLYEARQPPHAATNQSAAQLAQDIRAPQTNRATITLAGGQTLYLDSAHNGVLAAQGASAVRKLADGRIAYEPAGRPVAVSTAGMSYNTLFNPRGSRVLDMTLSDGSRIWLNAGSSITYPVAFSGPTREVTMEGEAYFEIQPDAGHPFTVRSATHAVRVLGTHFNVNAYAGDPDVRVTLLEGAVRVDSKLGLRPGEQAIIGGAGPVLNPHPNLEAVMAWKNGLFYFDHADLPTVLRELGRWYDVQVEYQGRVPAMRFGGKIDRNSSVADVLKILALSKVQFRIEGRKIIVLP
ncbi:MAG TPA: FecR domain-containing protein [Puia sp.]|nr:FecR domain-containing protein [Puia sp.]